MVELTYMLDTSVLIHLLRRRSEELRPRFRAASGRIAVSTISVAELEHGLARSSAPDKDAARVEALLALCEVLQFDRNAAHHAGRISGRLAAAGTPIGPLDTLIAGHARSRGLVVVTTNLREFSRAPGLECEDWSAPNEPTSRD
ncbi:MAG: type II toxin-antitoxin system VapC family toxin [Bifidobacteriaceae bacterium]|jgi:tRNA(fMet)-specific endonuclease VapC|nr:type II toxin-antitoxin system VapC family toxin [Bifidobacteriaceae bacterium]